MRDAVRETAVSVIAGVPPVSSRVLLQQEWLLLRRDRTYWGALLVFALLAGYGLANGIAWVRAQRAVIPLVIQYQDEKRASAHAHFLRMEEPKMKERMQKRGQRTLSWHAGIASFQLFPYLHLPPGGMAALSLGQSDLHPSYLLARTRPDDATAGGEIENPANLLTGRFDMGFVVVSLYPLLILAVAYDLLSAERERGTLVLSLSQPVSLGRLLAARVALRALFPLLVLAALAVGGTVAVAARPFEPVTVASLLLWVCVVGAYGAFWFAAALAVNALGKGGATNAVLLSLLWMGLVVVVPSLAQAYVTVRHPTPSRLEVVQTIRQAADEMEGHYREALESYYRTHPDRTPKQQPPPLLDDFWTQRYAVDEIVAERTLPLLESFDRQRGRQRETSARLRLLSPALLAQEALDDLSGTGEVRYGRFAATISGFREEWKMFFRDRIFRQQPFPYAEWDRLPRFVYQEEGATAVAFRVGAAVLGISAFASAAWAAGAFRLRRYEPAG